MSDLFQILSIKDDDSKSNIFKGSLIKSLKGCHPKRIISKLWTVLSTIALIWFILRRIIRQIPSSALEQLRELEHLNLNQNNITSIPTRAFHGCHKVWLAVQFSQEFWFVEMYLLCVFLRAQCVSQLTRLTLYDNKIHFIHGDAFDGVQKWVLIVKSNLGDTIHCNTM